MNQKSIDPARIQKLKQRGNHIEGQCPACAAEGSDSTGNHFFQNLETGAFGCVVNQGDKEHRRRILELLGTDQPTPAFIPRTPSSPRDLKMPETTKGTRADHETLAELRGLSTAAIEAAAKLRFLSFGQFVTDSPRCWFLHDTSKKHIAEARRLDGKKFPAHKSLGERKSHACRGSRKSWPIGVEAINKRTRSIMLVEGMPDYLAALHAIGTAKTPLPPLGVPRPVAMLGAGSKIDAEAVAMMAGKHVRIYPHHDPQGQGMDAARRWAEQLTEAGCTVDAFDFADEQDPGGTITDLNDYTRANKPLSPLFT